MVLAVVLVVIALGSVAFHLMSPWWSTPIASNWDYIDHTITITFWITGVAFVALLGFIAYCLVRFRHREGVAAAYEPESKRLELWLTGLTSLGVAGMLAPGLFVWHQYVTVPDDAAEIEIVGQQWLWSFRMPGQDGRLGKTDVRKISDTNSFGIDPDDPAGRDDIIVYGDDLHLARGRPVKFLLRSVDVLHDFYVPQFRAKMDMVPGMVTYFWATPTKSERLEILCAELCGTGHYTMRGGLVIEEESDYQAWLQQQQTFGQTLAANKGPTMLASNHPGGTENVPQAAPATSQPAAP